MLAQKTKPELDKYDHAVLFIPTKIILIKAIKQGFIHI